MAEHAASSWRRFFYREMPRELGTQGALKADHGGSPNVRFTLTVECGAPLRRLNILTTADPANFPAMLIKFESQKSRGQCSPPTEHPKAEQCISC